MQPDTISTTASNLDLLRLPQVKAQTGLSRSELYRCTASDTSGLAKKMGGLSHAV